MRRSTVYQMLFVAFVVACILIVWFWPHHSTHHRATCWAEPGVFVKVDNRWVAYHTAAGTRHGRGTVPGVCGTP